MALYVIRPPDPPAGQDWQAAVPGQYLYNVTGVYATLTTGSQYPFMPDASGNGNDGFIGPLNGFPVPAPGLVAGNGAQLWGDTPATFPVGNATAPMPALDFLGDFALDFWVELGADAIDAVSVFAARSPGAGYVFEAIVGNNGNLEMVWAPWGADGQRVYGAGTIPADGNPHYVTFEWFGGVSVATVDLTVLTPIVSNDPSAPPPGADHLSLNDAQSFNSEADITTDEIAIYAAPLGAGRRAAHFAAASVSFAAYTAAVLADAPTNYYHLDEGSAGGRQVTLSITDSNNEVERIPSGFDALATPGPYAWSWLPQLNSAAENATTATITVPLPLLLLPAGYTIGTKTLDIEPTDQWSDIAIWWNSDAQDASQEFNPYAYPPGATLVYQQIQGSP